LAAISFPELRNILGRVGDDVNIKPNGDLGIPFSVGDAFNTARQGVQADYEQAGRSTAAQTRQQMKTMGTPYSTVQQGDVLKEQAHDLDVSRQQAMNNLNFQEATQGMAQFNSLMNLFGAGSGTALNLGGGFASQQGQAIGMMSNQSQGQGALAGGMAGASAGAALGPYGAIIGGVLGAAGGYFSAGA
jgi:hypothetical protein